MPTGAYGIDPTFRNFQKQFAVRGAELSAGTSAAGAITHSSFIGKITTEALTTAGLAQYTLTITNDKVVAADMAFVSIANGSNSQGTPLVSRVTCGAGTLTIVISNEHATLALNGTLVISFSVIKAVT